MANATAAAGAWPVVEGGGGVGTVDMAQLTALVKMMVITETKEMNMKLQEMDTKLRAKTATEGAGESLASG